MKNAIFKFKRLIKNFFFPFYKTKDIKNLFQILESDDKKENNKDVAMFVGGCVRNFLTSKRITDIDIATIFSPEILKKKFKNSRFKFVETAIEHGSITLVTDNNKFEITTLRKDISTDGRHAQIELIDNWKEDSNRRDFTINSIYMNKNGKIYDPQQGINDLENNIVKFIGDPQLRIEEDFLRIIRFLRFSIQYNSIVEKSTIRAIKLNISGIKNISKERILKELFKILKLDNFYKIIYNEDLRAIFKLIFPELKNIDRLKNYSLIKNYLRKNEMLFLYILLMDETYDYEYFSHKYKVSNKIKDNLSLLNKGYKDFKLNKDFFKKFTKNNLYKYNQKNVEILYALKLLDKKKITKEDLNYFKDLSKILIPKFPYDGKFLIKRGLKEGKNFGIILNELEKHWLQNDFSINNKDLEIIVNKHSK